MENQTKKNNVFISEEEKTLSWEDVQSSFQKTFGSEIYNSWLQKISLVKEYNDYLILSVPTRFFRDWIVSRYLDKILEQLKGFKQSLNRIEFKIVEETRLNQEFEKLHEINKVSEIKDSIINYNRLNSNLNFDNFIQGKSNDIALSYSQKVCDELSRYNPFYICGGVGLGKTHLLNAIGLKLQNENNAVLVNAENVGGTMYSGPGAGAKPTANSVLSDIIDIVRGKIFDYEKFVEQNLSSTFKNFSCDRYLKLKVNDKPGVVAKISTLLANNNLSIDNLIQKELERSDDQIPLVIVLSYSNEMTIQETIKDLEALEEVSGPLTHIRILDI